MYYDLTIFRQLLQEIDQTNRDLRLSKGNNPEAVRDYLIKKLIENIGDYTEAVLLDTEDDKSKLKKFGCLDKNNVINYKKLNLVSKKVLRSRVIELFFTALSLLRLEKVTIENVINKEKEPS